MWFIIVMGFIMPPIGVLLIYLLTNSTAIEAIKTFSLWWVFISPFWAFVMLYATFWAGRTIEILDTAKSTISFARDNKHHAVNLFQFFSKKVRR